MKVLRRFLMALLFAVIGAVGVRLGGASNSDPQRGGWRPLDLSDPDDS